MHRSSFGLWQTVNGAYIPSPTIQTLYGHSIQVTHHLKYSTQVIDQALCAG